MTKYLAVPVVDDPPTITAIPVKSTRRMAGTNIISQGQYWRHYPAISRVVVDETVVKVQRVG